MHVVAIILHFTFVAHKLLRFKIRNLAYCLNPDYPDFRIYPISKLTYSFYSIGKIGRIGSIGVQTKEHELGAAALQRRLAFANNGLFKHNTSFMVKAKQEPKFNVNKRSCEALRNEEGNIEKFEERIKLIPLINMKVR
jgi:hypothetical protein